MNSDFSGGLYAAASTPIAADGSIDQARFNDHCDWLLANGVKGICPFGTTGEGVSFSVPERARSLDALLEHGINPEQLVPATGLCSLSDSVLLSKHAINLGCPALLVMPPFFIKNPTDEGVHNFYAQLIDQINDSRTRILLYNIPQITGVEITHTVVSSLTAAYPSEITGIKDSAGDRGKTLDRISIFPELSVLTGTDVHIVDCLRAGGAGAVTGMANINPTALAAIVRDFAKPGTEADGELAGQLHQIVESFGGIAAMKAVIAAHRKDPEWVRVLPTIVQTPDDRALDLVSALQSAGHVWPKANQRHDG